MDHPDEDENQELAPANGGIEKNPKKKTKYPKHVLLIVGNEFCERFSYYGMRTVLVLYFRNFIGFGDDDATAVYHAFTMLAFFFPLFGGIISDSYWGKYKTIIILSMVYVAGHAFKTLAAIPYIPSKAAHIFLSCFGLLLIAIGTGGIKPCVSSFGGDQFAHDQVVYRKQFFSLFYFAINAGALLAKIIMPMFRADLDCFPGQEGPLFQECYAVAFGVPGLLMILATGLFVLGTSRYVRNKPTGSIFAKFCKCVYSAVKNRWNTKRERRTKEHWLDYADDTPRMIRDAKYVVAILLLFTPLPLFWALADQQGSRWTLQALQMDRYWGSFLVKPEQMDTFNPLLVVTLIPLFEVTLYPLLHHYGIPFSSVRRMGTGLILAGLSFFVTAGVQFEIDKSLTTFPRGDEFGVRIVNTAPCSLMFESNFPEYDGMTLKSGEMTAPQPEYMSTEIWKNVRIYHFGCHTAPRNHTVIIDATPGEMKQVIISGKGGEMTTQESLKTKQAEDGRGEVFFANSASMPLLVKFDDNKLLQLAAKARKGILLPKGRNTYAVYDNAAALENLNATEALYIGEVTVDLGGIYSVFLMQSADQNRITALEHDGQTQVEDINHFSVGVAWMIPQYVILTVGEIFLSVTGLEFAYTQAPPSMKSVMTSFWLLTMSLGNVIVMIVAQIKTIERQAHEFLLFAFLTMIASVIFAYLGHRYKTVDDSAFDGDDEEESRDLIEGKKQGATEL